MPGYHTIPVDIQHGEKTQGFFAYDQPDTLVIFVHGFNGSSIGTWNNFPESIVNDSEFSNVDFIFYGYDTFRAAAAFHSVAFKEFLDKCIQPRMNGILPQNQSLEERNYSKIILVAHSLGALIVRQAVVLACKQNVNWLNQISLLLFAPAHKGARVQKLAKEVLTGLGGIIAAIGKYKYPVYEDLEPDSLFISNLIVDTRNLLNQGGYQCNIAKKVIWAELDRVVAQVPFCSDPQPELVYGKGHINVCKPDNNYRKPIEFLKEILL